VAAAATSCVFRNIRSGEILSADFSVLPEKFPESNTSCLTPALIAITYSRKRTPALGRLNSTQRRVHFATWKLGPQLSWFRQEHTARPAGLRSTPDIWSPRLPSQTENAVATFAGTAHQRLQLAERITTMRWSTPFKSAVDHSHVQCIPLAENSPVSCAPSDCSPWRFHRYYLHFLLDIIGRLSIHISLCYVHVCRREVLTSNKFLNV